MPRVDLTLSTAIERTARVVQLEGIFDVPERSRGTVEFHFDAPIEDRPWQVGLVTGPSGAGKSSVARHLFGDALVAGYDWHHDRSVIDSFGDLPVRDITSALSSVGFSSPPAWVKPFRVLSNGEQFRATMARALVDQRKLVVIDEFTSVVDRTVARVGSHAIAKSVRARAGKQFVAVTCHDDLVDWLQPDWILEPHVGRLTWRSLQRRPPISVQIVRCDHSSWRWFAPHHYLSATLHRAARCFVGLIDGEPAVFTALLQFPHPSAPNFTSASRVVVLPDFQGVGLAAYGFMDAIGALCKTLGRRLLSHPSHPALIHARAKSPNWLMTRKPSLQVPQGKSTSIPGITAKHAAHRRVASFEYVGPALPDAQRQAAAALWAG